MSILTKTDEEILAIAEPIWDNMVAGVNEVDCDKLTRDFSVTLKQSYPCKELKAYCEKNQTSYGQLTQRKLLGCIRREQGVTVMWTHKREKAAGDVLGHVTLDNVQNEIKVVGAYICQAQMVP